MKFKTSYEIETCQRMKDAVGEWITTQRFPLFGTATYRHAHHIRVEKAQLKIEKRQLCDFGML